MAPLPPPRAASATVAAIYAAYEAAAETWQPHGLPISAIGTECDRQLWYMFRWAIEASQPEGRILRLFGTGDREELRLLDDLRRIGCEVVAGDERGRQFKVYAVQGHLRGKLDGVVLGVPEAPQTWHVVECKSHNARHFAELVKKGVKASKPGHFAQCQLYMHLKGLDRALYLAVCKNTDELYAERIPHDPIWCECTIARAARIIHAARPPAKLHLDPEAKGAFACRLCPARAACHDGAWVRRSCRTCLHATPVDRGWHCARRAESLIYDQQHAGCAHHLYIPDLVPGEQVDADDQAETVTYALADGKTWVDGQEREMAHAE